MKTLFTLAAFLLLSLQLCAQSAASEQNEIREAIQNYVEAFYQADTAKAYESIAKDLAKEDDTQNGQLKESKMSFEQLVKLAQRWKFNQNITVASPKKITVFEVLDKIASAKVEAKWGIDYFHLAKIEGRWMIVNVLWQDYGPAKK